MPDGKKHPDPLEVAPQAYRVVQNDRVRVLSFVAGPGEPTWD